MREGLRREHGVWADDPPALDGLAVKVAEHDTTLTPSFALVEPGEDVKPDTARLLGMVCEPGQRPTTRLPGLAWAVTPVDGVAHLCRHHDVELAW